MREGLGPVHRIERSAVEVNIARANANHVFTLAPVAGGVVDADEDARALGVELDQLISAFCQCAVPDFGERIVQWLFALFLAQLVGLGALLPALLIVVKRLERETRARRWVERFKEALRF